jgi:hypothetical protein
MPVTFIALTHPSGASGSVRDGQVQHDFTNGRLRVPPHFVKTAIREHGFAIAAIRKDDVEIPDDPQAVYLQPDADGLITMIRPDYRSSGYTGPALLVRLGATFDVKEGLLRLTPADARDAWGFHPLSATIAQGAEPPDFTEPADCLPDDEWMPVAFFLDLGGCDPLFVEHGPDVIYTDLQLEARRNAEPLTRGMTTADLAKAAGCARSRQIFTPLRKRAIPTAPVVHPTADPVKDVTLVQSYGVTRMIDNLTGKEFILAAQ